MAEPGSSWQKQVEGCRSEIGAGIGSFHFEIRSNIRTYLDSSEKYTG